MTLHGATLRHRSNERLDVIHRFHAALLLGMACVLAAPVPAFAQALPEGSAHLREVAEHDHEREEEQEVGIIVQGTRLGRRLHHEPLRVEVTAGEEIEEKALMRPGNIAMLVNEIGGVRVQVTSPALGAANVRIQGLEGRYTQLRHSWPEVSRNPMPCLVSMPFGVIALLVSTLVARTFRGHVFAATTTVALRHHFAACHLLFGCRGRRAF